MDTLIYDGTFEGFLTAYSYNSLNTVQQFYLKSSTEQINLFVTSNRIVTKRSIAYNIWQKIEQRSSSMAKLIYFAFMSEENEIEQKLEQVITSLLGDSVNWASDQVANKRLLEILYLKVNAEKNRLQRFTKFQPLTNGKLYAEFHPTYNTLPLITRNLKSEMPGANWIIWDTKRNYGIQCHNQTLTYIGANNQIISNCKPNKIPNSNPIITPSNKRKEYPKRNVNSRGALHGRTITSAKKENRGYSVVA
ncbi:MAG: hypothetical protein RLZZ241_1879 [Bacteroidota bacterium]